MISPSLAAGIYTGLDYLTAFPYECTEQTVGKFLPNAVTYRLFKEAGKDDPIVEDKSRAAFLVADKTLGNVTLDIHKKRFNVNYEKLIAEKRAVLGRNKPPDKPLFNQEEGTTDFADGKSGNRKLGTKCSYCGVKHLCWDYSLRAFNYSGGPRFLTQVVRLPDVPELNIDNPLEGEENNND